ncbi:MAG: hypothetical protein DWQ05_13910 [Calditrichaeota bacterium]|nr:MAG: hypothetical protein DWQ05_13910 [Calditrichota bacterium]
MGLYFKNTSQAGEVHPKPDGRPDESLENNRTNFYETGKKAVNLHDKRAFQGYCAAKQEKPQQLKNIMQFQIFWQFCAVLSWSTILFLLD